ncbi:Frag1/DRAM/Sfk1 family protein [Colletotrichum navitas]|uniref:Frag1/DRAM/Sfk1 family protein n=1 Tax=Colletotrichum navitas TaxID=681940 RepID=A0AAD8V726_9PEZI|nr:Frag1/DRAM/Sfk1 family protein [Colletotrichum navitas]KAK1594813.1 Frag1/DRAM/Sfk1 family protein [Colletotrichum navitas]
MRILSYWIFPIISGLVWLGMLLGMLLYWIIDTNRVVYPSMTPPQTIAYISDVGAYYLKPLFITGCVITAIFLDLSFFSDRWLRHRGRLVPNTSTGEKVLYGFTIFFALVGTVGLVCLSIFDTYRHKNLHLLFLLLFMAGYLLSAIFICWEYQRLGIKYPEHPSLAISFWIKLVFIIVEVALAVAFIVCNFRETYNTAAVLEWVVAFIFSFYVFSFTVDLLPAARTRNKANRFQKPGSMREWNAGQPGQPRF